MSDVKQRLQETTMSCLEAYDKWSDDQQDSSNRESLQEAVHELRKVAARLEIDIALSDRDGGRNKSIPIPKHRSASKKQQSAQDSAPIAEEENTPAEGDSRVQRRPRKRRPVTKPAADSADA